MEIRQLRYFLAVIQKGGVGAAAASQFVTQPAVSAQIKRLEEEIGELLFERRGRRLVPTEMGRHLARRAEDILRRLDDLERSIQSLKGLESGRLAMGTIDAASVYILPEVYRAFRRKHPGVRIEITIDDTSHLLAALRSGDVELATTTLPIDTDEFTARPIYREHLVPVAHPSHPLASKRRVSLADLSEHGVISYPSGATTRRLIESAFAAHGVDYRATMELSSPEAMKRLAQAELGVSILPRPVIAPELKRGALKELPMGTVRVEREIGMVYRDRGALSPPARVFLEMVEAVQTTTTGKPKRPRRRKSGR